jgi:hypothetical protein
MSIYIYIILHKKKKKMWIVIFPIGPLNMHGSFDFINCLLFCHVNVILLKHWDVVPTFRMRFLPTTEKMYSLPPQQVAQKYSKNVPFKVSFLSSAPSWWTWEKCLLRGVAVLFTVSYFLVTMFSLIMSTSW